MSEVLQATWAEFDLEGKRWNIPGERTKTGVPHHVPLSLQAIAVMERVRKHKKSSVYLFPKKGDASKPRNSVKSLWISALHRTQQAGVPGLVEPIFEKGKRRKQVVHWKPLVRIHDLRHSFASNLASNHVSLTVIANLLGHSPKANTVQRYAHIADKTQRDVTDLYGAMLAGRRPSKRGAGPIH